MSLTEKAEAERMWGRFPALRGILETKKVPDHYFGFSSAADNIFEQLDRLLRLATLIRENKTQITEALKSDRDHGLLRDDLRHVREEYRWAGRIFQNASKELDEEIGKETGVKELLVMDLIMRLAWYIDKHGDIPEFALVGLFTQHNEEAQRLRKLVSKILEHFNASDVLENSWYLSDF